MFTIRQISCMLYIVILANLFFWPPQGALVKRRAISPEASQKYEFREMIELAKPQIVFIGNSTLREGVEPDQFSQLIGMKTINLVQDGSASAWWYLALKNVVLKTSHKPEIVGILFRDHYLTDPSFRVDGTYKWNIEQMAEREEPLLDRLAYLGRMDTLTYFLLRYCPLFQKRDRVRAWLDTTIKDKLVSSTMKLKPGFADRAIERVFADENMDKNQLTVRQLKAASLQNNTSYDFKQEVEQSFLPYMIKLAKDNDINLVFIRLKRRRDTEQGKEPKKLKKYIQDLNGYLSENDLPFLDFTHDERIKIEHFDVGDHLAHFRRSNGREVFTQILAEGMRPVIRKLQNIRIHSN